KVEIIKHGRPEGWHGQSWVYYKGMMMIVSSEDQVDHQGVAVHGIGQQVMMNKTGTEMWKYLENIYEGKTNAATRANQEIILFNRLQAAKCKAGEDVGQHVDKLVTTKAQLEALNAGVRGMIFTQMLVQSLPKNERFDRRKGMMESGLKKMD
ncbi:hypothetical protein PHYSODRAFT_396496, partial [Phytophthora sojae]